MAAQPIPIIDGHVHFVHLERMGELLDLMAEVPCAGFNLVSVPEPNGDTHNSAALYLKRNHPGQVYACAALDYRPVLAAGTDGAELLARQAAFLRGRGFDGLKLIEGKPQARKLLPHPLDGPLYARMWPVLEQEQLPVVFHVGDPEEFWDPQRCPDWARQAGWDYSDGSYPSREALYAEIDNILVRHPDLKIVFAHFYFLSGDLIRAGRFLDQHPSVNFDLAPHVGMYHDFSRQRSAAREFFLRYHDRILYGTDVDTRTLARGEDGKSFMRSIPRLIRAFLETDGPGDIPGWPGMRGLGLPESALANIYQANFTRLFGGTPVPVPERVE